MFLTCFLSNTKKGKGTSLWDNYSNPLRYSEQKFQNIGYNNAD